MRICNTNVYKNNSGHSIGLDYSVSLMNRTPYFLCDGNLDLTATEVIGHAQVIVEKSSDISGKITKMLMGIDFKAFITAYDKWVGGYCIQDAFPNLSADEREFIKTGITPDEWESIFG